jgi:hypothetical protein
MSAVAQSATATGSRCYLDTGLGPNTLAEAGASDRNPLLANALSETI